jgi:hypothetical protein
MTDVWDGVSEEARKEIEMGEECIKQLRKHESYERWLWIGAALDRIQREAMRLAGTNDPIGRGYNDCYRALGKHAPKLVEIDKGTRSYAMWMAQNRTALGTWVTTLPANQRFKLYHPGTIKKAYDRAHMPPTIKQPSARIALQDMVIALQSERDALVKERDQKATAWEADIPLDIPIDDLAAQLVQQFDPAQLIKALQKHVVKPALNKATAKQKELETKAGEDKTAH